MDAEVASLAAWLIIVALAVGVLALGRWLGRLLSPFAVGVLIRLGVLW